MRRKFALTAGLVSVLLASPAMAEFWVPAGFERGQQVFLQLDGMTGDKASPFTAVLASFPRSWPANHHRYTVWIAEFDCQARTRSVKSVAQYSSDRDPERSVVDGRPAGESDPAVAAQLNTVCGDTDAARRGRTFNHLGEVARSLGR